MDGARTSWGGWSTWILITHSQSWWRWFSRCSDRKQVLLAFQTVWFSLLRLRSCLSDVCSPVISRKLAPVEASCVQFDEQGRQWPYSASLSSLFFLCSLWPQFSSCGLLWASGSYTFSQLSVPDWASQSQVLASRQLAICHHLCSCGQNVKYKTKPKKWQQKLPKVNNNRWW